MDEKYVNGIINDIETSIKKEANLDSILASVYQKIILKLGEPESIKVGNKKKVVFFVGPTGVGKTTTIAKLASEYKINQNKKVALITADVYRIAAVEQLNTYASILDVPVNVIYSPSEIVDNVKDLSAYDVIMVDTAGRSHKNVEQRNELFEIVNNVKNAELDIDIDVFLVLSVTTKYRDLMNIANAYKELEGYKLLFTKLDETGTIGNIMNMRCYTGAPLSYITSGQNVPDDIELADVQKLAKMLLGGE
jgi:flagellar biosynthesis protein FlhF